MGNILHGSIIETTVFIKQLAMNQFSEDNLTGVNHEGPTANFPLQYLTASSIIGDKVRNLQDENMGEIKDIMIDTTTGKIDYLVIEFGGFLGMGVKYFAVPFNVLTVDTVQKGFIFNQPKEILENAPGFDKDQWPNTNNHQMERVYNYWSFT